MTVNLFGKWQTRGEMKAKKATAKKMLEENIDIEIIKRVTGLKENEILGRSRKASN